LLLMKTVCAASHVRPRLSRQTADGRRKRSTSAAT
jgi:hypothetical protein